jgi:hypothetical protein
MFEGISRYRGPYAGGALAILFYMKQADLDKQLQKVYLEGFGEDFVGFCNSVIPEYPVYEEYRDAVEQWPDCLENAMILYSGYQAEKIGPLADAVNTMKRQELAGKRWFMLPTDEKDAAGVIAQRAFEGLSASKAAARIRSRCIRLSACMCIRRFCAPRRLMLPVLPGSLS